VAVAASALVAVACLGTLVYALDRWSARVRAQALKHWRGQLTAMAEDRAGAVAGWVRERQADARTLAAYPSVVYLASGREGPPFPFPRESGAAAHVVELLGQFEANYGYEGIWVVRGCRGGRVVASAASGSPPPGAAEAACSGGAAGIHLRDVAGAYRAVVAAPVLAGGAGSEPAGAVVATVDPRPEVFARLQLEPLPTATGETLLVGHEGPDAVFLSPLRHSPAPPGTLRLPLAEAGAGLAAREALAGRAGFGEFHDYRGAAVLAAIAPIGPADWGIVVKIDRDEALRPYEVERRWAVLAAGALLTGLAGLGFGLWRQNTARARLALARSEARFAHLVENAADAILFVRPDGRIVRANQRAADLYGYTREQIATLRVHDLYRPEQAHLVRARMAAVQARTSFVFEAEHRGRDGSPIAVEVASRFFELDDEGVFVSLVRDIRERKRAEARAALLNRTLRTLAEINQLSAREPDRDRLLQEACRALVEHGGFRMAWIGLHDAQSGWVVPAAWAGEEAGYLSGLAITSDARNPAGRGPVGTSLREARTVCVADTSSDESFEPFRGPALERGFRSVTATPIRVRGEVAGVLALYSGEPGAPSSDVLPLIEQLAGDIGFAFEAREARRERDEAAARLAESRDFLQALVDSSSAAIFTLRPDGRVGEVWNPAAERMFGWRREEVVGAPLPIVDAEHQDEFRALREHVLEGQAIAQVEVGRVRRDGTPVELSVAASPLHDAEGRTTGVLAVALDVSERVRQESELRQLSAAVEQSPAAIVITDTRSRIEYVNRAFTLQTGWTREEVIGRNPSLLKSGHHPPEFYAALYAALARGDEYHAEMLNRRKDGTLFWERAAMSPIRDPRGRITHYLAVKEDITQRRESEAALRRTQEQLAQSQKLEAVGRLAGGIAHDFNNLLGVIIGHGELAEASFARHPDARRRLQQILDAARRAAGLTRQLLAFSRRQVLEPRVLDLNAVVAETGDLLRRLIGEDVSLVSELDPALGRVRVDPGQLSQILVNLAVNARDAMPRGGTLRVVTSNADVDEAFASAHEPIRPGRYVQLVVADTGVGMDEAVRSRAFEPFFTTKPEGEGSGLGLSTVYGIVKQSGGYVWLDSAPGRGATITIHLPRVDAPLDAPATPPPAGRRGSETVLVVEDQDSLRDLICEMLADAGYSVLAAADGLLALETSAGHPGPIDLLVTDVIMPGINGRELLDRVRDARPGLRALFISGYTNDAIARSGARIEGASLLEKPFGRDDLLRAVREALSAAQGE
jgi:PAS domain S-box-containing protein